MRLTRAGEYAVRCVLYLARRGQGVLVGRMEIAERTEAPPQFLAKIAQQLARAGIIEIRQGANGGYLLLPEPAQITLLQVIEAIIGEIALNDCVNKPGLCGKTEACTVHRVWVRANQQLRATLAEVDFATLAREESWCLSGLPPQLPAA